MHPTDDPGEMNADQRFHEIAAILAGGLLRVGKYADSAANPGGPAATGQNSPKSGPDGLEVSGEIGLSVRVG